MKGKVKGKTKPIGQVLTLKYRIKDSDSVPAILTPGEYVLSKKMIPVVKKAFAKAKMKPLKGL
jgi:hypothetical protein